MRRSGWEWIGSFERALQAEEHRFRSRRFRRRCPQYLYNYLYFRSGLFGEQIERYLSYFERWQFHFLTLDQLVRDPQTAVKNILTFLDVSSDYAAPMEAQNTGNLTARFPLLQFAWNSLVPCPRNWRRWGDRVLGKCNTMASPPLAESTKLELTERYRPDLQKLYALTGVELRQTVPGELTDRR
jgi:hypothetical protein